MPGVSVRPIAACSWDRPQCVAVARDGDEIYITSTIRHGLITLSVDEWEQVVRAIKSIPLDERPRVIHPLLDTPLKVTRDFHGLRELSKRDGGDGLLFTKNDLRAFYAGVCEGFYDGILPKS